MTKKWLYIVLAVVIVAALALLIFQPFSRQNTTTISLPTPQTDKVSAQPGGALEVTVDTVQTALRALSAKSDYNHSYTVTTYWQDGSSSEEVSVFEKDGSVRISRSAGETVKNTLITDGRVYVWYDDDSSKVFETEARSFSDVDAVAGLITYEELLSLPPENIYDAKYVTENNISCIYVKYSGAHDYTYELYVSVDSGILVTAAVYDGDNVVYTMATGFISISPASDDLFVPPVT